MKTRTMSKRDRYLIAEIQDQARWVVNHGENLAGYVQRYGSKDDPDHYGDGGEAIYEADYNCLRQLVQQALERGLGNHLG